MNSRILVVGLISIVLFGSFLLGGREKDVEDVVVQGAQNEVAIENNNALPFKTELKKAGAVDIQATPVQLEPGREMVVELSLNTHSVDLGYEFAEISYIEDNLGNKYKALGWSGEKSGHHLGGTLSFGKLEKNAQSVTLMVSGVDNQDVFFEWEL